VSTDETTGALIISPSLNASSYLTKQPLVISVGAAAPRWNITKLVSMIL
jgi:hypothetical protein